ncbi:hypothetical protein ABMA27_005999 [Loxostege sticticalis]|uniref:Uncharacterized protein n=1 Tax=Loxostege sticticalis TaxID=481309 RepID=A0ABR3HHJ0_LOXSC
MELVSFAKEVLQNAAEHAASYRLGQSALRHLDRALWVVEKCARWAVPPPLDQDERPQPELVRPLPWIFFLALLITLRITRESISLVNLVMGKPPLRSADVVTYIQSKRRYLRTLKYQGSRLSRARAASAQPQRAWYARLQSLFEFTMCFRSNPQNYGNNNTTRISNNDEVLVVKRNKRTRQSSSPVVSAGESTMERLIEKMMIDLDADSDDDSSFTLTNVTSIRSDRSDTAESDQDTVMQNDTSTPTKAKISEPHRTSVEINFTPNKSAVSTPERTESPVKNDLKVQLSDNETSEDQNKSNSTEEAEIACEDDAIQIPEDRVLSSPKEETQLLLQSEKSPSMHTPKTERSIANGVILSAPAYNKGVNGDRRDSDVSVAKTNSTDKNM